MTLDCPTCNELTDFTFVGEDPNTGAELYECMVCEERVELHGPEQFDTMINQ
ncbi:hypothetical protein [Alteromonas sp. RKMC-009]|uniref:hypothetical protein n=1 Tax=Alteromonas sp. RKMC-009 TaxID=2267264 RepID=UPI001375F530|nr:hypothetical protein [Alteromonas sp. RKMC-009]